MDSKNIIQLIRSREWDKALDELYANYPAFKNSFVKSGGKKKDAEDIFQDALLVFIEKVSDPQFKLTCSINTYLFSICRNLSLVHFKKDKKDLFSSLEVNQDYSDESSIKEFMIEEEKFSVLDKTLKSVGKKCTELLSLFYLKNLKMAEVAKELGFKSETSAKTQKYKCIEKAKSLSRSILADIEKK